ncbi:MAG: two-component system regulatory protein YycI [Minisyncoccia bacterium]
MNWSKAKSIMVIIFIFLNIILYLSIKNLNVPLKEKYTSQDLKAILSVLSDNNIYINTHIPEGIRKMPLLKVERQNIPFEYIKNSFLKGKTYRTYKKGGYNFYESGNLFIKTGTGYFYYNVQNQNFKKMDNNEKAEYISDFLKRYNLLEKNAKEQIYKNNGEVIFIYTENYKDYFLDLGKIEAKMTNDYFTVEKTWFLPVKIESRTKEVIPAIEAIMKLIEINKENETIKIEQINLGYYFNWQNAQMGDAVPVWRLTDSNGKCFYINAYTGIIENGQ